MQAKKQLRKPENWDDFESLCKKLWGEIWDCPEIKKNGKKGQRQQGVDLYGTPRGENAYFGIQCKGKDDYSHKHLTKNEIDKEIEEAKGFKPPLKKLYFATTADKDTNIEEYIREKNIVNINNGLFEIHLYSWQDLVDLIDENKETHDWYLKNQNFRIQSDVKVTFDSGETDKMLNIPFARVFTHYKPRNSPRNQYERMLDAMRPSDDIWGKGDNLSYGSFKIKIFNSGSSSLHNSKLSITIEGSFLDIQDENLNAVAINQLMNLDAKILNKNQLEIIPTRQIIVPKEDYITSQVRVKPVLGESNLEIRWEFISQNHSANGLLGLKIRTYEKRVDIEKIVESKNYETVEETIEDYYTKYDND